ncbi:TetR family transcriptional regulator [Phytomonospora sp. NPDC050363]|uniref:TetR/AcrR family transcriptional regulator n=1 Tax=Phytomonospora sp. NPDC050363 TaxID=3155642 RepID=UPI0033E39BD6
MSSEGRGLRADAVRNRRLALEAATALLAESGAPLTVEAIATRAGLGAGTVVRAFGGKGALIDAAVSGLLGPMVERGRDLLGQGRPLDALRAFLAELIAFQSAHHGVNDHLGGLDLPETARLRAELEAVVRELVVRARAEGSIRADLDPGLATTLIGETAFAVARAASPGLAEAYLAVMIDGLRPPV